MTIYLDYAGIGLVRESARTAMRQAVDEVLAQGSAAYGAFFDARKNARHGLARLLDCAPAEIALTENTTTGVQLVADGLEWRPGDEVVVFERDFPANVHPWRRLAGSGVRLRWVAMHRGGYHLDDVEAAIGPATRLVAVSQVNFGTGFRIDLDVVCELARRVGALVFVDAAQSLGVIPVSMRRTPVDFLAAGGHKWLCAPPGTGVFYCRQDRLGLLANAPYGWFGYDGSERLMSAVGGDPGYDLRPRPTAARFEGAMPNFVGFVALAAAVRELETVGIDVVAERVRRLTGSLRRGLVELGYRVAGPDGTDWSGIVGFTDPTAASADVLARLSAAGCVISSPNGMLRASPHYWTTDADEAGFRSVLGPAGSR